MMVLVGKLVVGLIIAIALGAGSAWFFTSQFWMRFPVKNGPWGTSASLGNDGDSIYMRAYSARIAWFSNDPEANVYYTAFTDSSGRALDENCNYRIIGAPLDARWWSVTAYKDLHWMSNERSRYSYTKTNIVAQADGSWSIALSRTEQGGNWLPVTGSPGKLALLLRLYDPSKRIHDELDKVALPRIEREACR